MFNLSAIQQALQEFGLDGWLLYDFRGSNVLAHRVLGLKPGHCPSRRFLYYIPADGEPQKLVHRIEQGVLDHLPGSSIVYLPWQQLEESIAVLLKNANTIAMEYSPRNANPYVAKVDAGTVEVVRGCGVEIVSSGDLVQLFEATLTDGQVESHFEAEGHTKAAFEMVWVFIAQKVTNGQPVYEHEVQQEIMRHFEKHGMTTYHPPIVAVNANASNPHYGPSAARPVEIKRDDLVLVDLWAKMDREGAIYSDLTKMGFVGSGVPDEFEKVFQIVAAGRDAGIELVRSAFASSSPLLGWQVDQATRDVIVNAGYGEYFVHRTGHSIGQETHGNGANMDNLETREERRVLPGTCFSIEPGIYLENFGVRSEINVIVSSDGKVTVTGGLQRQIHEILAS